MKKILFFFAVVAMCATSVQAQEAPAKKQTVIVDVFTVKAGANATYRSVVTGLRDKVISAMNKTQRINVIDVTTDSFFQQAAEDASSEAALNSMLSGNDIRQSASKNFEAKYAVLANVTNINATREKAEDGHTYFNGAIAISMKVINLEDGTVVHSKDYNYAGITGQIGDTEVAAVNNTANYLVAAVPRFIDTAFPITGQIIDILSEKKGAATEVYVNLGTAAGVKKKDKFEVYQIKTIAGNEMKTEIGDLTVTEVGGDAISTCKVSKCGEAISQSISDPDKVKIVIISRPKSNIGGAIGGFAKGMVN